MINGDSLKQPPCQAARGFGIRISAESDRTIGVCKFRCVLGATPTTIILDDSPPQLFSGLLLKFDKEIGSCDEDRAGNNQNAKKLPMIRGLIDNASLSDGSR